MYFKPISRITALALYAISLTGNSYAGQEQKPAESEIVLTVSGQEKLGIDIGGSASFSIDMLRALPSETFETSTQWTIGTHKFTGASLGAFIDEITKNAETKPAEILAIAANEYAVTIPVPDVDDPYPIIAYEMDGEPMALRDKGPLWIVYPYDSDKKYISSVILSRSIWQVIKIELQP